MKYIFFGTPKFAETVLKQLITEGHPPELVVCNPDRPVGRDQIITPPETKVLAQKHNIEVYQPDKLSVEEMRDKISSAEIGLVAAYGKIIPEEIINLFPKGIVGIHPSLLPKYRGPTPIRSAILEGEETTGVTLYSLDKGVDSGPIISKETIETENKTYPQLKEELALLGAKMVIRDIPSFIEGNIDPEPQDDAQATHTSFFHSQDGKVDYNELIEALNGNKELSKKINLMIKALNPEPGVWTKTDERQILSLPKDKRVKLLESHLKDGKVMLDLIHVAGKSKPRELN